MSQPDPAHMETFYREVLPEFLQDVCRVPAEDAKAVADDVRLRGEAFASLDQVGRDVLMAPFIEDVFDNHLPKESGLDLRAAVTVVVRNSRLEDLHVRGLVEVAAIKTITTMAAGPLSHLLAARRRRPGPPIPDSPFAGLKEQYPRAWTCLAAVVAAYPAGGRVGYREPKGSVPELPSPEDRVEAEKSTDPGSAVVFSAIDPRFDQDLIEAIRLTAEQGLPFFTTSLSRLSRNSIKLLRVLEYLLAHHVPVLTTNYLLRSDDAWLRRRIFIKPDVDHPERGLRDTTGLNGTHRSLARSVAAALEPDD
jgi:hypothetical protein